MGITSSIKTQTQIPHNLNLKQIKDMLQDTSELLQQRQSRLSQNKLELKLSVSFDMNSLRSHLKDWKKHTVSAYISNYGISAQEVPKGGQCTFDMEQIYNIHQLIKHFRKQNLAQSESRQTKKGDQDEQKQCCICFDQKATTMLPCGHSYCVLCTSKYIIQQEDHRCPKCRRQFTGNSKTLKKEFYEVIQEDNMIYEQARNQILQYVAKYNVKTMQILQQEASQFRKK